MAFTALALYCLARAARGPWTRLGVLGGGGAAAVSALHAAALLEAIVFDRFSVLRFLAHQNLSMVLDLMMTVSVLALLTAVVADRPDLAAARAQELTTTGVEGLCTFEGPHDVFLPLVSAASAVETELMTNVAIALPRSPLHLAHAAYDLQLLSGGRFRLGLGSQIRPHIENRYGAPWSRPAARMRESVLAVQAILRAWQDGTRLDFRGEFTRHRVSRSCRR